MAETIKILGQSNPAATTATTLYTTPGATSTVVSSIVVCNQAASAGTFRISLDQGGGGDSAKDYLYYDQAIEANSTFIATIGITLAATDLVRVYASSATMSFNLFGAEYT